MRFCINAYSNKNDVRKCAGRLLQNGASYGVGFSFFFMGVDFVKNDVQSIGIQQCFESGNVDSVYPLTNLFEIEPFNFKKIVFVKIFDFWKKKYQINSVLLCFYRGSTESG